jgi:N utilization substance protein A
MAALVPAGAPVSVLIDHGLAEDIVEKLLEAGVATVEKLGSMTPEELESIPSIGPKIVEKILVAVNSYYAQFEPGAETESVEAVELEALPESEFIAEEVVVETTEAEEPALEAESGATANGAEAVETGHVPGANEPDEKKEFDTIENSEGVR